MNANTISALEYYLHPNRYMGRWALFVGQGTASKSIPIPILIARGEHNYPDLSGRVVLLPSRNDR